MIEMGQAAWLQGFKIMPDPGFQLSTILLLLLLLLLLVNWGYLLAIANKLGQQQH